MPGVSLPRLTTIVVTSAFVLIALLPASASAHITGGYLVDPTTNLRTLLINSDAEADSIRPGCTGNSVTVNGRVVTITGLTLACSGEIGVEGIRIFAGGGNDTIDLTTVTNATFPTIAHHTSEGRGTHEVEANGDDGNDTLIGGPLGERFNDSFSDFDIGGADTVHGNGGEDKIRGTTANDNLFGDGGNDVIDVGEGADVAHGGPGKDSIHSTEFDKQPDKFYGEAGIDQLIGDAAPDFIDGGPGADFMDGGPGNDKMYGRAGNDGLFGKAGSDTIFGNAGKDYIRGGPGNDKIHPGSGKNNVKQ